MRTGAGEAAITILVPTRDRTADLVRLLDSLTGQTVDDFRALIIDQSDAPEPNRSIVEGLDDPRFEYVVDDRRGKSRALNLGIERASSEVLAFTDDDCEVPPTWLEHGRATLLRSDRIGLLFGQVIAYPHDPSEQFVPALTFDVACTFRGPIWRSHGLIGIGANMFARRSALMAIGLFDEDLGPGGVLRTGEDVEVTYRMLRGGYHVVRSVEAEVVHYGGRPVADGTARTHWIDGGYAEAAGYGKHVRARDLRAGAVFVHEIARRSRLIGRQILRRQRPFHVRTLRGYLSGFVAGWRSGPNWAEPSTTAPVP